jgi:predicted transposase/invertase (TIGR01784 family)
MPSSPHDAIFKASFGQPDIARSELELVLPADVRSHLELATLEVLPGSFVDEALQQTHTDLLYAMQTKEGQQALVYVLFEHQSTFDATMPYRILRYLVRVWERWMRDHPAAKKLPIVLPVLLHHGDGRWQAAPELASMLDASPELLEAARPYQPHFRFVLDDLSALSLDELAARTLHALGRLVQMALWSSRSMDRLQHAAPLMGAISSTLVRDARTKELLLQLYQYLWHGAPADVAVEDIRSILFTVAGPHGAEDVVNAAQQLIEQGRAEGRADWLERGRAEGLRDAITHVLIARTLPLSEASRARLTSCADVAVLTGWLKRAATAVSEAEVFADADSP